MADAPTSKAMADPAGGSAGAPQVRPATAALYDVLRAAVATDLAVAQALGLSRTDLHALQHLVTDPSLGPSALAHRLGITTASATAMVDRLEEMGHLARRPDALDRRRVHLDVAPSARAQVMAVVSPLIAAIDGILADFDDDEAALIARYLGQVRAAQAHFTDTTGSHR